MLRLEASDSEKTAKDDVFIQVGQTNNGLVGHWPLDETSGNTAFDFSGNANHGTLRIPLATLGVPAN